MQDYAYCLQAADTCMDDRACEAAGDLDDSDCDLDIGSLDQAFSGVIVGLRGRTWRVSQYCPKRCRTCEHQKVEIAALAAVRSACEEGWTYADGACFKHFTEPDLMPVSWSTAEAACKQEGAKLAIVDTPIKNHVLVELIRQRPKWTDRSVQAVATWIGLRTRDRGLCSSDPSSWKWRRGGPVSFTNWLTRDPGRGVNWSTPICAPTAWRCAVINYPDEHFQWYDLSCASTERVKSWACSKPALVRPALVGTSCSDLGMAPINDVAACEAAAGAIGWKRQIALRSRQTPLPEGCLIDRYMWLVLAAEPDNRGRGSMVVDDWRREELIGVMQICQQVNASTAQKSSRVRPHRERAKPPPAADDGQEVLSLRLVAAAACLSMLLIRRRHWVSLGAKMGAKSVGFCAHAIRRKKQVQDALESLVRMRLAGRREQIAVFSAAAVLVHRLLRFFVDQVVAEASCEESGTVGAVVAGADVMEVCASCLLLAIDEGRYRSLFVSVWVLLIPSLRLLQMGLSPSQVMLSPSRLYEDVIWRVFIGAAMRPSLALAVSAAYCGGAVLMHWLMIPDGLIRHVQLSGCPALHTPDELNLIIEGINHLADMASLTRQRNSEVAKAFRLASALQDGTTSVASFALAQLVTLVVTVLCLVLVSYLMTAELRSSLKLQSTESLLAAVSEMLGKLCDAVIQLDSSLNVIEPSSRFAAMLNRQSTPLALETLGFKEHLKDEQEEEKLRTALQKGQALGEDGCTLSVKFKDASGCPATCQVFHAAFRGLDGQLRYTMGLNEIDKEQQSQLGPSAQGGRTVANDGELSESSSSPSMDLDIDQTPAVERQFDLKLYDFMVTRANVGALHFFGSNPAGRFLDEYIKDTKEWRELATWQTREYAKLKDGILPDPAVQTLKPFLVAVNPYKLKNSALDEERVYRVDFEVTFPPMLENRELADYEVVARIKSAVRIRRNTSDSESEGDARHKHTSRRKHRRDRTPPAADQRGTQPSLEPSMLGRPSGGEEEQAEPAAREGTDVMRSESL